MLNPKPLNPGTIFFIGRKKKRSGGKVAKVFYFIAADRFFERQEIDCSMILVSKAGDAKRALIFIETRPAIRTILPIRK
jgi:hypothetical protein